MSGPNRPYSAGLNSDQNARDQTLALYLDDCLGEER